MESIIRDVGFVHLRVHSAYSLLEGALQIKKLAALAKADRMPALGIADTGNLFGALEFAEKMVESGIQPIVGTTDPVRLIACCAADGITLSREEWYALFTAARGDRVP